MVVLIGEQCEVALVEAAHFQRGQRLGGALIPHRVAPKGHHLTHPITVRQRLHSRYKRRAGGPSTITRSSDAHILSPRRYGPKALSLDTFVRPTMTAPLWREATAQS